jgi:hypothetical protein
VEVSRANHDDKIQRRVKNVLRENNTNLRLFRKKPHAYCQRHDIADPELGQRADVPRAAECGSGPILDVDNEAVATSLVIHIEEHILTVPRYTDRSCQTDLRPNSSYSMYELVSAKTLDECTIPDGRPPPYTLVAKR